nr:DUF697 domain-containing protein [uncultured Rhodopila sp.]
MNAARANAGSGTAEANKIVWNYTLLGLTPGIVPVPWVDLPLLTGIQLKMLHSLARLYEIEFSTQRGKSIIGSLVGASISTGVAGYLIPMIPGVGTLLGGVSTAVLGGASTYAVGKVFIQHFDSGGTLLTFDPDKMRDYYTEHFAAGRARVAESFMGVRP